MANKKQLFEKVKATGTGAHIILQKSIGYFSGLNLLLGIIVGSGIFISPAGVLRYSRLNVGVALSIWAASGVMSMLGALCYTELGTALPSSGGDYYYVKRGLGPFPAFLLLLVDIILCMPVATSIKAITFAEYATKPFYTDCPTPEMVKKVIAMAVVIILTAVNGVTIKGALWVQKIFTILKMQCLVLIAIGGLVEMAKGNTKNLENAFDGEVPTVAQICLAFYQGLFAYGGWNGLNKAEEEVKNTSKNVPRCIITAVPLVIVFYLLVNISYMAVLTPKEMVSSAAVAVTWANKTIGPFSWIIPLSVAISTFGSINGSMFLQARLNYAASKEGHLPAILSMLHINYLTPAPAIIFSSILSIIFIIPSNLSLLMIYSGFASWLMVGLTCISLIVLRFREPNLHRPYKVFLPFAFVMAAASFFLVLSPIIQEPEVEYIYGVLLMLSGFIFYIPFVHFKLKFRIFDRITSYIQLLMEVSPPDSTSESKTH
ncbi:b(0,+)-type amino acid transporter 1-like isoform X1 [Erpetoichthys calabaricus]|uniref:b(0,+)-type amino acid transporter 1-like isoform X1 n=1 Tax=Erpetoichthys calabaricus TaxID=27687 RepID=UPI002234DB38|nr:b(0,+)-type amino acid transporter 1-like isoform X1 [Erpetoichthys calabaricus]